MEQTFDGQSAACEHGYDDNQLEKAESVGVFATQEKIHDSHIEHVETYSGRSYHGEPYQEPVIPEASSSPADESAVASLSYSPSGKYVDFNALRIDPRYIKAYCRKYEGRGISDQDLLELAKEGVYRALERFDPEKSAFQTYATIWMKERITQRFKDMQAEQTYLLEVTKGVPMGSVVDDKVEEVSVTHSYYHEDGTIDAELADLDTDVTEIPENLDSIYLDHICSVCQEVLKGEPRIAAYHRMLSAKPAKKWRDADILDRQENYQFLKAVAESLLRASYVDVFLKRFGVQCASFAEIALGKGVTSEAVRCEFLAATKDMVGKLQSPITRCMALAAFKKALHEAKKPLLGGNASLS
jgi:RNA polymerase sigma factor (sigma-70 family)